MPIIAYITWIAITLGTVLFSRKREWIQVGGSAFFAGQLAIAIWLIVGDGQEFLRFFRTDTLGLCFFAIMSVAGCLCYGRSTRYLDTEPVRQLRIYTVSFILLSVALTGVYFSENITVTWIFLEATSIAAAGLTYHRRTLRSLEATWKYIFVTSVGIAIAYLGILLLCTVTTGSEEAQLTYRWLAEAVAAGNGNPLYMKLAFLFILVGYSSKMEVFPFYTVGVDANHSAPSPASAFLSSALVGGGFVALFRVYRVFEGSPELIGWGRNVLLLVGVLSLLTAAVYMGRTRNLKRLAAYSTVENSALVLIGLGIGGIGVWAAVLHALAHAVVKCVFFLQLSVVGKVYGNYRISRNGSYYLADPLGALVLTGCLIALLAVPPSILFRTEYLMLSELIFTGRWWIMVPSALFLLTIVYWLCSKIWPLLYKPTDLSRLSLSECSPLLSWCLLLLLLFFFAAGAWQGDEITRMIDQIVNF